MIRKLGLLVLLVGFTTPSIAQTKHTSPKKVATKKTTTTKSTKAPKAAIDTTTLAPAVVVVPEDTTKTRDTSAVGHVAQEVHDSVKAQIKAPIVQVPITLKSLIVPGILFAYGAITLNSSSLRIINENAKEYIWDGQPHSRPYIEDYLLFVPAAAVYGLNIAGVKGQNNLLDRSLIYGMSNALANGISFGLKTFGIQQRPDSSDNFSFASGHTAEAFVSAEFFHQEYKNRLHWTATAAAYSVAVGVGYLRMYHNKHWLSDVVAGAGIGIASTRFSYYLYPLLKHVLFGSKKVKESAMIMPTYSPGGVYGLSFMYRF
jgi:membrane-associated phospholipid phosphatase